MKHVKYCETYPESSCAVGRMIPVIQSQDFFPLSDEQECRKKLKIMCGSKSRES